MSDQGQKVILAVDIGSSSVRCTAFVWSDDHIVVGLTGSSRKSRSLHPISGKVCLEPILTAVEECVDDVLQQLTVEEDYEVVAVGLTSFVMNLVGVDGSGTAVGDDVTISYVCNTDAVAEEVRILQK